MGVPPCIGLGDSSFGGEVVFFNKVSRMKAALLIVFMPNQENIVVTC